MELESLEIRRLLSRGPDRGFLAPLSLLPVPSLPGMASSLSSVPPVWPSPLPDTMGTLKPQAASAGARGSDTLSPTPPVLCLSTTHHSGGQLSTRPDRVMAEVSWVTSLCTIPRVKMAISSAPVGDRDGKGPVEVVCFYIRGHIINRAIAFLAQTTNVLCMFTFVLTKH